MVLGNCVFGARVKADFETVKIGITPNSQR